MEFTGGSGLAAAAMRRDTEAAPAQLREGTISAGEPLLLALPHWSAHDRPGRQRCCAAVSRATRASSLWPAHGEAAAHYCARTLTHTGEREAPEAREKGAVADKSHMRAGETGSRYRHGAGQCPFVRPGILILSLSLLFWSN
jgi:hypothetical protein